MLPYWSSACTVTLKGVPAIAWKGNPAVAGVGADTANEVTGGVTLMLLLVPVSVPDAALRVRVFGVLRVTATVAAPFVKLTLAAEIRTVSLLLLVRLAKPLKVVTGWPF